MTINISKRLEILILPLAFLLLFVLSQTEYVNAQAQSLADLIGQKFADAVVVKYESPTSVVIGGDLIFGNNFNTGLWEAMDLLKSQYGFTIQQVITSGVGSVGNPTTVYILMTK